MSISSRRAGGQSARASFVARFARVVVALSLSFLSVPLLTQASYAEGDTPIVATETTADPPAAEDPPAAAPAEEPAAEEPAQEPAAEEPAAEEPAAGPVAEEPAAEEPAAEAPAAEAPASDGGAKDTGSSPKSTGKLSAQLALPAPDCGVTDFNQNTQENSGGSWINGALNQNNSNYAEGDYVPQRVLLNGLVPGTYTIGFSYDVTKNGKYAYDFVKFLDISGSAGASVSWDAFEGPAPVSNPPVGTQTEFVTITFTIVAAGDDTATISWAGHIASEIDYGPNSSAGSISGAPYHFSLVSTTGTWGCGAGNRDNQLMADAVDFATITVIKNAVPNSSQDFSFSASTPNGNTTFDLDDDADGTLPNTWTRHVAPGVTTVTEGVTPGWDLTDLTCTGSTAGVESGTGVALTLADNDSVTCTFTNSHESSIEVDKYWIINGGTPVLEGSEPGHLGLSAQLMIDQANKNWDTIYGGYLEGATANLAESVTFGNDLCTWASADTTQHGRLTEENTVAVNLELPHNVVLAGGDNHYTITNRVTCNSTLTLQKSVQNGDALASAWTLSATPTNGGMAYASGSTGVTHTVTADSAYTLSENAADPRYQQVGPWSCTQYGHVTNGSVSVDAGRTATCTVTNATAELILKKVVQNPNGGTAVPANFTLVADPVGPGANLTTPGSAAGVSFFVNPGETFNLSETGGPDGYTLSGINCGNGSVTSVQVPVSTTVTCTFTNVDSPGVLTLNKHVVSDSGDGAVATDWTLSATPVGIANQPVISGDGTATGATKAGTYQLAEDGLAGYAASAWDCNDATTDADVPVNADDQIAVGANQEVVCDITNRAIAPTLTLVKSVKDPQNTGDETGPGAFTLTATPDGIAGQGALSGPGGASDTVKVGTYTLSEVGPATYAADPAGWSCVDDDGAVPVTGSQVTVGLDQDVVCTIINNAIPSSYMLEKTSDPASGATVLPNSQINYTVTLTKVGDGVPVENFDVTDTLTGVEDGWVTGLADDGATILNGVITWHVDELGNTPLTLTYTVTVGPDAWDSVIDNQVTPGPTPCVNDGDVDCDFTEHFTPHYTLDKAVKLLSSPGDDDGLAEPGEQLEYSLTVLNDTEDAFVNTTVTDDLSNVLSNAQMITSGADLLAQGLSLTGDQLTWTINDLAPGDDLTVTYVVQINDHAWHVSLDNIATPGPLSGGECIPAGDVPGDGVDDTTECETSTQTPDVTTMVVEKRDVETDEVLPGATFELFVDANNELTEGGDCTFASPPVVDDADQSLGTSETDADGQALFHELQHGCYLLVETIAPDGYSLPEVHVMGIQIDEDNFVGDDGEMAAIVVTDFGEGHLAIVAKRQFEEINGTWVESDGKVGFGDHVRYVVRVEATGPKNFHDVKVTDFIPGFSPEDTTSTVKATLVEGSAVCENGLDCTTSVDADNEVTWNIGDLTPGNGETMAGDAVMEVVFPDRPANLQLDPGETYEAFLWNVGYLQWTELTSPSTPATRIAHAAGRAGLLGTAVADLPTTTIKLRSNEVVVSALFKAPAGITHGPGPGPIPQTGAPAGMAQLALFGLALIAGGLVLMRRTRKE